MKDRVINRISIIIIAFIAFFGNLWVSVPDIMEIRNFVTAREMVVNGHWIVPTMNGAFRFEKPPLPTWITAGLMKIFGVGSPTWLLRIPAGIVSLIYLYFLYKTTELFTGDKKKSLFACFIASSVIMLTNLFNENTWDIFTHTSAFAAAYFSILGIRSQKTRYFIYTGISLAISILSKGPVGIYVTYISFLIAYFIVFGIKGLKCSWKKIILSFLIGVFISALWLVAMYFKDKDVFMTGVFEKIVDKEVKTWSNRKQESIFYYFDYFAYLGVWLVPMLFGIVLKWSKKRVSDLKSYKFILLWNLLVFIFITCVGMKKKRYALPLYMLSPMIIVYICDYYFEKTKEILKKSDKIMLGIMRVLLILLCILVPAVLWGFAYRNGRIGAVYAVVFSIISIFGIYLLLKKDHKDMLILCGLVTIVANLSTNWYIDRYMRMEMKYKMKVDDTIPRLSSMRNKNIKEDIYGFGPGMREVWNVGKEIKDLKEDKYKDLDKLPKHFIFISEKERDFVKDTFKDHTIIKTEKFYKVEDTNNPIYLYTLEK